MSGRQYKNNSFEKGSALILTVVLSSILAIVGVLFVLASRVEKTSTKALTDERDLIQAVDSIITKLSNELVLDTPGIDDQEYYDYPGEEDRWLAAFEPFRTQDPCDANDPYYWTQISDLTGYIRMRHDDPCNVYQNDWGTWPNASEKRYQDVPVNAAGYDETGGNLSNYPWNREIIPEYHEIKLDEYGKLYEQWADADGDGIADSKWIELQDMMGNRGQKMYAAIRVIDNCAMINVNTAYEFDPNSQERLRVDGSRLHQINLKKLSRATNDFEIDRLVTIRDSNYYPLSDSELESHEFYATWRLADPCSFFTLFDIADELEMRYRFCIDSNSRPMIENVWPYTVSDLAGIPNLTTKEPYNARTDFGLEHWQKRITDPNVKAHDRRHLLTAVSLDRIISAGAAGPGNAGMENINLDPDFLDKVSNVFGDPNTAEDPNADPNSLAVLEAQSWLKARDLYQMFSKSIDSSVGGLTRRRMKREFAQLAVNMVDFRDRDNDVTSLNLSDPCIITGTPDDVPDFDPNIPELVYGIEPFPVITHSAIRLDPNDPCSNPNYFAVELYNPFDSNIILNESNSIYGFELVITDFNSTVDPNDPNRLADSQILAVYPLPNTTLGEEEYMVIRNQPSPFLNIHPTADIHTWPSLELSEGYRIIRGVGGFPDTINSDLIDTHNPVIRRRVCARLSNSLTVDNYIYLDRQIIFKDWAKYEIDPDPNDPNAIKPWTPRLIGRDYRLETSAWWDVVYPRNTLLANDLFVLGFPESNDISTLFDPNDPNLFLDPNDPNTIIVGNITGVMPRPFFDIAMPYRYNRDLRTVGDIVRIWTEGPTDSLSDPPDANNLDTSLLFDPNSIDVPDINDPNLKPDPCHPDYPFDPNSLLLEGEFGLFAPHQRTVGEKLLFVSRGIELSGRYDREDFVRLNLADPCYASLFQYITVLDPRVDGINNDGDWKYRSNGRRDKEYIDEADELKVPGRININTAPAYIIQQLPWMRPDIAEAVVAYRDKLIADPNNNGPDYYRNGNEDSRQYRIRQELRRNNVRVINPSDIREQRGFTSIAELNLVVGGSRNYRMSKYADYSGPSGFPDLTQWPFGEPYGLDDGARDDFDERDMLFARVSNLATVRSDVFTAYILVRLGHDGPQKRMIAILDRSDIYETTDKVKVIVLQSVPEPR